MKNNPLIDLRGQKFGRLIVLIRNKTYPKSTHWICKCDCYNFSSVESIGLRYETTKSCGCLRRELRTKHGLFKTDEYSIWKGIIDRCHNQSKQDPEIWARYGGRGIEVSKEWRNDVSKFYEDMGPRPSKRMTVERIDNNKGYCKENCKWATRKEQGRNRHDNHIVVFNGVEMPLSQFRENHCSWFTQESLRYRLKQGLTTEQIIQIPKHTRYTKLLVE